MEGNQASSLFKTLLIVNERVANDPTRVDVVYW